MENWRNLLIENQPRINARVQEMIRSRRLQGYGELSDDELERVVREAVSARLAALTSGETNSLDTFAAETGRRRAGADYHLRDVIGLAFCIKDAMRSVAREMLSDPKELFTALETIDRVNDRVIVGISDAFSQEREETIRAEEAGYISLAEVLKEELARTDERIQQLQSQISAAQDDLKEMRGFRDALLSKLINVGLTPIS